jgi:hypothetical protein
MVGKRKRCSTRTASSGGFAVKARRCRSIVALAASLVLVAASGCGPLICGEFSSCSPRSGPRGAEKARYAADHAPGSAAVYWVGEKFTTGNTSGLNFVDGEIRSATIEQTAVIDTARETVSPDLVYGSRYVTVRIQTRTPLPRPTGPPPANISASRLLFSLNEPNGQRADVYVYYPGPTQYDDLLRDYLRPQVQPVPRTATN